MNPPDWDSVEWATMQDYDRPQWAGPEQDIGKYTVNYNDPHDQQDHYRYHPREPQRPTRRMEYGQHSIPSPSPSPSTGPSSGREPPVDLGSVRIMTLDRPSVEGAETDNELERKKKKLQELENQIIRRKAAIALKKVLPYLKKNDELSDNPTGDQKDLRERCLTTTNESSLKERVNCILKLRKSPGLPKMHSRDPTHSTTYGGGRQEDHPLKLRVKTLMDNRSRTFREGWSDPESSPAYETGPTEDGQRPVVPDPPMPGGRSPTPRLDRPSRAPSQRPAVAPGMQRFLNVLNKGVNMDLFTSIVNDNSQSVPQVGDVLRLYMPPSKEPSKKEPSKKEPSKSEIDRAEAPEEDSRPSLAEPRSRSRCSTELPDPEGSPRERSNPAKDGLNHRGSRPSGGPRVEQENPMQLQLQNILKSLGLSLDKEEMSGLTSRTEERLYGKRKANGQGLHNTSVSEMPAEPAPETCPTRTSVPPQPPPASRPPPVHTQGNYSMECRKRRQCSPCSQSEDRSSGDSGQRERCSDDHKRRETDGCGDAETDKGWDGDHHGNPKTYSRQDGNRHGDSETYSRQDGDRHGNTKTYNRRERDYRADSETDQWGHGDRHGDSETYKRRHRERHGDSETYKRWHGDRHGDSETYKRRHGDRHGDSETYKRRHGDGHAEADIGQRWDRVSSGDSETDRVKMSSCSPQALLGNPDYSSALAPPGNTSAGPFQNAPYHGGGVHHYSHVNTPRDEASSYPLPDDASSYPLPDDASSYPLPDDASSYPLPDDASSPAPSTPWPLGAEGLQVADLLTPDLSLSEGQHWSAQRCLQVINIRPAGTAGLMALESWSEPRLKKTRAQTKELQNKRGAMLHAEISSGAVTEVKPALPKPDAELATLPPPRRKERVTVQKQKVLAVQKEPTEEERKATLKAKLQAFNQKMRQSPFMPAPVSSCTYSDLT